MLAVIADALAERRDALCDELGRHGHDVRVATSVDDVLAAAGGAALVVLGPQVDGRHAVDVCRELRATAGGADPLVVLVGAEGEVDVAAALDAGATDVWALGTGASGDVRARLSLAGHFARLQSENVRVGGELALLRQALDLTGTGFVLTDPRLEDNPIVFANESFLALTGFAREEVIGRNCRFLQGPATESDSVERLRRAVTATRPVTVEITNHRKDGTPFVSEVHIAPVRDERGEVVRFVGVQVDISVYRAQESLYAREHRARRDAEAAGRRSAFLAGASPLLDASLDLRTTLESLTRLSVPHLADLCLVDVADGDRLRRMASAASDPEITRALRALPAGTGNPDDDAIGRVLASGRAEVCAGVAASEVAGLGRALGARAPHAAMLVPLKTRGRTLGVLVLASLDPERRFGDEDLAIASDLARRAALAVDNAQLFGHQRDVVRTLQESLLPDRLPSVDGIEPAAAFRPAGDGTEVGGDFYDAFPARDGVTLAIGDVCGKGARAAALTGLSRHTLRTAAMYEHRPSDVLAALNRALLAARDRRGRYCTVALAQLRPAGGHVDVDLACAGHPLPLVLRASGVVEAAGRPGTVLGYVPDPRLHDVALRLDAGDALVLYTDGLTEARTPDGSLGDERFAGLVRECAGLDAVAIADRLERAAVDVQSGRPRDDVAIAVARVS